jgi:hypothetical protein
MSDDEGLGVNGIEIPCAARSYKILFSLIVPNQTPFRLKAFLLHFRSVSTSFLSPFSFLLSLLHKFSCRIHFHFPDRHIAPTAARTFVTEQIYFNVLLFASIPEKCPNSVSQSK